MGLERLRTFVEASTEVEQKHSSETQDDNQTTITDSMANYLCLALLKPKQIIKQ